MPVIERNYDYLRKQALKSAQILTDKYVVKSGSEPMSGRLHGGLGGGVCGRHGRKQ